MRASGNRMFPIKRIHQQYIVWQSRCCQSEDNNVNRVVLSEGYDLFLVLLLSSLYLHAIFPSLYVYFQISWSYKDTGYFELRLTLMIMFEVYLCDCHIPFVLLWKEADRKICDDHMADVAEAF